MRGLIILIPVNANLEVEIKLGKSGDVYYRVAGEEEWIYSNYTIMKSVHNYYVAKRVNRVEKMMQGTKRECLKAIINMIRTAFTLCQRRY